MQKRSFKDDQRGAAGVLKNMVGTELSSVEFVRDYLQMRFDGHLLTVITHPSITKGNVKHFWDDPAFCTLLINCISKTVDAVQFAENMSLTLAFSNDTTITISLLDQDYRAAEAVIYQSKTEWISI